MAALCCLCFIVWCFPDVCLEEQIDYCLFHFILPVPVPTVEIIPPGVANAYAGSQLTLTCSIVLDSTLFPVLGDLVVTGVWTWHGSVISSSDGHITVSPLSQQDINTTFISTVMFNTLWTSDAGTYTCKATVAPRGSTAGIVTNGVRSASRAIPAIQSMYVCYLQNVRICLACYHMFCPWNC